MVKQLSRIILIIVVLLSVTLQGKINEADKNENFKEYSITQEVESYTILDLIGLTRQIQQTNRLTVLDNVIWKANGITVETEE